MKLLACPIFWVAAMLLQIYQCQSVSKEIHLTRNSAYNTIYIKLIEDSGYRPDEP